jgi:hypothetical protein
MKTLTIILVLAINVCSAQTTLDERYKVEIIPTDSISIGTVYKDKAKRDSITNKYSNWHERSRALEKYLLKIHNPGITRDKDDFVNIKLSNGETIKLIPDKSKEETDFIFEHYFRQQKLLVFRVQWYEGDNYAIIDLTNGQKTYMLGRPYFSPDSKLLISINCDIEAQYSDNGFQLFEFSGREIKKIWEYKPAWWGPTDIKWLDNFTITSRNQALDTLDGRLKTEYKKIKVKRNAP